ncbi:FXYD domain-containing ion transport regulator 5 isoform X4 [Loxodonta africana]|uniref:FXYD domain-containing ion transport regulator 5 isoform X4 n=1 Tax=Loxodonta africana TaxID=9785 RepID=UPI0005405167
MSPSGRLCLLSILGLVFPTRGQVLEKTTPIPQMEPDTTDSHVLTQVTETTQSQTKAQTRQPTVKDELLTTEDQMDVTGKEDTTLSKRRSPSKDIWTDSPTPRTAGSGEVTDNPFFYDEDTLRKRGLLIAAVLFITGIIILTSGKYRQMSKFCRNSCR